MALPTKNQIVKLLQLISSSHAQLKGFGYGDLWDLEVAMQKDNGTNTGLNNREKLPFMWITPVVARYTQGALFFDFQVVVGDAVFKDCLNELEVESDTLSICLDILAALDQQQTYDWELQKNGNIEPFTEKWDGEFTGHIMNVTLEAMFTYNRCDAPFDDNLDPAAGLLFFGEEPSLYPATAFDFIGTMQAPDYATVYLGQYQSGVSGGPDKTLTGFTVPTDTPGNIMPWIAAAIGGNTPGITAGRVNLPAGQTDYMVAHTAITGSHTIIPCDENMAGMVFLGLNDNKTAAGFTVGGTGGGGWLSYIIVEDGELPNLRSASDVAITGGGDEWSFDDLGTEDYTVLCFDTQYVGKLPTITKHTNKIEIETDDSSLFNIIILLNT